ncbi:MFS transporter [Salinibacter sp. 10B]|uniref:MFS transporter n=1 Tax=Salinibacter sp. 10B TaxID=1923971 RepID=UPI000CF55527|nr:MFS transporter [Salinibacter sp. 10B]PQJ34859.1 MFS transporter [Salinibacter sp. 10B]
MSNSKTANPYLILFALWLMMFSASSQLIIMVPILPEIADTLGVNAVLRGMLLTAYALSLGASALITGPASDRVGRRKILLYGSGILAVTLTLHTVAADYELLLLMRLLAGIGGGMLSGGTVAYVGDYFPYEQRGWANGWVMSGTAFGQVLGVPLGKVLATGFGYRWPFLMFAITMALATVLIWLFVPQPNADLDEEPLTPRRFLQKYRYLLGGSEIVAAVLAYFLMFCGFGLFTSFLPTWLETEIGISGYSIALLFAIGGTANVLASPLAGRISDEVGRKPLVVWSCLALGLLCAVAPALIVGFTSASILFFLAMISVGIRISPLQSLMTALVSDDKRGLLMGMAISLGQGGFGIGSFVASLTYGPFGYTSNAMAGALAMVLMAALVHWGLPEPSLSSSDSPSPPPASSQSPSVAEAP